MDTMEVVIQVKDVLLFASLHTTDDLNSSLQQHDLPGHPFLQDQ